MISKLTEWPESETTAEKLGSHTPWHESLFRNIVVK